MPPWDRLVKEFGRHTDQPSTGSTCDGWELDTAVEDYNNMLIGGDSSSFGSGNRTCFVVEESKMSFGLAKAGRRNTVPSGAVEHNSLG